MSEDTETRIDIAKFRAGERGEFQQLLNDTCQQIDFFCRLYLTNDADREAIISQVFYELFHQRGSCKNYEDILRFILERAAQECTKKINFTASPRYGPDLNMISESMQQIFSGTNKNQWVQLLTQSPPINLVRFRKPA